MEKILIEKLKELSSIEYSYTYDEHMKQPNPLMTVVLNYIREQPRPPISSLLTHKNELYIIIDTHGMMRTNEYELQTIRVPKTLSIYRLPQTQYGVCSYTNPIYTRKIYDIFQDEINNMPRRRNQTILLTQLKKIAYTFFLQNESIHHPTITNPNHVQYKHFREYVTNHIPEISLYNGHEADIIMDKHIIIEIYVKNGKIVANDNICIVHKNYSFDSCIKLLHYINPQLFIYKNNVLYLYYTLSDVIDFVTKNKITRLIIADLSCSNSTRTPYKTLKNTRESEQSRVLPEKLLPHLSKNNQLPPGKFLIKPRLQSALLNGTQRHINAYTASVGRRKTRQRSYFPKNRIFTPPYEFYMKKLEENSSYPTPQLQSYE
jgi:hypothetical protein